MNVEQEQLLIMISVDEELEWIQMVQKTWQSLGKMKIISEVTAMQFGISTTQIPSSIIIDASSIRHDLVSLVKEIHQQFENVPIVVASASPNWEQARDVFHAGAADYVKRTTDVQNLIQLLKNYAGRASPPDQ